jgi:hypothetical protein
LSWEFLSLLLPSSVSASHPFFSQWRHAYANLHEGLWTLWSFIYSFQYITIHQVRVPCCIIVIMVFTYKKICKGKVEFLITTKL